MHTEKEFTDIYNSFAPKVYRLCLGYASGDEERAKEWQQETFVKVWNYRKSFNGKSSIGTWIYRIAVNICLDDLRKSKKQVLTREPVWASLDESSEEEDRDKELHKMYQCIEQLNQHNKALILLELEEVPQVIMAETLGIAQGALRTRLSRIRKALLKCITNERR